MKVYVVTSGTYSDYHIVAAFDDKQKAEVFCAAYNDNCMEHRTWDDPYYIEEYDTEENHAESNKPVNYWVTVCKNFKGRHVVADDKACTFMPTKKFVETGRNDTWEGIVSTTDDDKILKIFHDQMAQRKGDKFDTE